MSAEDVEKGLYTLYIHSNLAYDIKLIEPKKENKKENIDFLSLLQNGKITQGKHTKTKEPFKILKLDKSLSKEAFKSFNQWLKGVYSGYYSRFVGGFILPNDFKLQGAVNET